MPTESAAAMQSRRHCRGCQVGFCFFVFLLYLWCILAKLNNKMIKIQSKTIKIIMFSAGASLFLLSLLKYT